MRSSSSPCFCFLCSGLRHRALGGKTLLPADNLYQYEPWRSFAAQQGLTVADGQVVPYNHLISDLVLENVQWKSFIVDALKAGRPADILWNPRSFAGTPFFAAGQHSAAYPLSLLFYVLPLWRAYGVFTWLQIGLAAVCMYMLHARRWACGRLRGPWPQSRTPSRGSSSSASTSRWSSRPRRGCRCS